MSTDDVGEFQSCGHILLQLISGLFRPGSCALFDLVTHILERNGWLMWGLEHLLLFGVAENKSELINRRIRRAFPFRDPVVGDAHFAA